MRYISTKILLCFDFGIKNIGVAVGQYITKTASSLHSLKAQNGIPNWKQVKLLLNEWQPDIIIIGMPLKMNGSKQPIANKVYKFANLIKEHFSITVKLHDERLSTMEAKQNLFEKNGFCALSKNNIDSTSAKIILESYLSQGNK